jgi:hypothetical protein
MAMPATIRINVRHRNQAANAITSLDRPWMRGVKLINAKGTSNALAIHAHMTLLYVFQNIIACDPTQR